MNVEGKVIKYGDNVDTDVIIPARYLNTIDKKELASHCMEDLDASFSERVKTCNIIVGGNNFGCGSSREHAPLAIKESGVTLVIAKSFARIHAANLINAGIIPLTLENPDDYDELNQDDNLELCDIFGALECGKMAVKNKTTGKEYTVLGEFSERQIGILRAGGLLPYTKTNR